MPRHSPSPVPASLAPSRIRLAAYGGHAAAMAQWEAHLDAGRIGGLRDPGLPMPDYLKLDRLMGINRVGRW